MKFQDMPYERIDFAKVQEEMGELIRELDAAKSGEEQFEVHKKYYALTDRVMTLMTIANIRFDIDTSDKFYEEEHKYYDEQGPVFSNLVLAYQKKLYESPYRAYLEEKIGPVAFKNMELAQKSMSEALIPLMQEENSLTMEYDKLIAGAKIDFDGRELNLSLLRPYLVNSDRNVRRQAWEKMSAFFLENEEKLDSIYDKLVKNRTAQARAMGYENYLELGYYRMNRNCYGKDEVEAFRRQIKEYFVPFAEKLHDRRRQRLGLEKLSYIDEQVYFKDGNPAPTGTPEEIMAAGQKMYRELSPETAEFFDFMMENQLFDVLGRKTKKAGGYMTYLPSTMHRLSSLILTVPAVMWTSSLMSAVMHSRGILLHRILSESMRISAWRLQRSIPCPWNFHGEMDEPVLRRQSAGLCGDASGGCGGIYPLRLYGG